MKIAVLLIISLFASAGYGKTKSKAKPVPEKIESVDEYKTYLREFVALHRRDMKGCEIQERMKNKKLSGKMVMYWEVGEDGVASDFSRGKDTLDNNDLYHCLEKKIMAWKFPKPPLDRPIELEHEFSFSLKRK